MNSFEIKIPRKDHELNIKVEKIEKELRPAFNLFYNDNLSGCMHCNENNVWIYEPHAHEALLLNAEEIQHLGKEIGRHSG